MAGEGGGTDQLRRGLVDGVAEIEPCEDDRGDDVRWKHDVQVRVTLAAIPGNEDGVADGRWGGVPRRGGGHRLR